MVPVGTTVFGSIVRSFGPVGLGSYSNRSAIAFSSASSDAHAGSMLCAIRCAAWIIGASPSLYPAIFPAARSAWCWAASTHAVNWSRSSLQSASMRAWALPNPRLATTASPT